MGETSWRRPGSSDLLLLDVTPLSKELETACGVMPNLTERLPTPNDVGRVVAFVASEAAWHITGADIAVDGGARDA